MGTEAFLVTLSLMKCAAKKTHRSGCALRLPVVLLLLSGCATTDMPQATSHSNDVPATVYAWPEWSATSLALLDLAENEANVMLAARGRAMHPGRPVEVAKQGPLPEPPKPEAKTPPPGDIETEYAEVGKSVKLGVAADGSPPFTYEWKKDGQTIAGATTAVFTIPKVNLEDAGTYVCMVRNAAGSQSSQPVRLIVRTP